MASQSIMMTPSKRGDTTVIKVERVTENSVDKGRVALEGSGEHRGIVINKPTEEQIQAAELVYDVSLEFRCYLVSSKTGKSTVENRRLRFAFSSGKCDKQTVSQNFFSQLVRAEQFPRDYVGFIKKLMKQLQVEPDYSIISAIECEFSPVNLTEQMNLNYEDEASRKVVEAQPVQLVCKEALLRALESAYPNVLTMENLLAMCNGDRAQLEALLREMKELDLIDEVPTDAGPGEHGKAGMCFRRKVLQLNAEVREIKQISQLNALNTNMNQKPTIGIITAQYFEKLAVDAMMDEKTTFVHYKTDGESTVYTVGTIGRHRVVCTKLPVIGRDRSAMISASNQTTRLCGIFQDIEHVFLVGVAGGVPHYTDFYRHSRRGDIVVSAANSHGNMYLFCEKITERLDEDKPEPPHVPPRPHPRAVQKGAAVNSSVAADKEKERNSRLDDAVNDASSKYNFSVKSYVPHDTVLSKVLEQILDRYVTNPAECEWGANMRHAQTALAQAESMSFSFARPAAESDRLLLPVSDKETIEVQHPVIPDEQRVLFRPDQPNVRLGALGAGLALQQAWQLKAEFATKHELLAFDYEFDQVLDSLLGSRKDSFLCVRGIADYSDGLSDPDLSWQPYAALAAAGLVKAIVAGLPPPAAKEPLRKK